MSKLVALVDCNNFYASCERLFNPRITKTPVVVLSNNDGCAIARSNEAKAIGIPMGEPFFKWKYLIKEQGLAAFSPNFALYGDLSNRVMCILNQVVPHIEIYSIDEAFLHLENNTSEQAEEEMREVRKTIKQWVGIPVSIGIAATKTLAKAASEKAKKNPNLEGVLLIDETNRNTILKDFPIENIWGIGRKTSAFLRVRGIHTALDLIEKNNEWIKKNITITGVRTAYELRGTPCLESNNIEANKKSIVCSRSFGRPVEKMKDLEEAVTQFGTRAAEKLREQNTVAAIVGVFIRTSHFREDGRYGNSIHIPLTTPTNYTPDILKAAHEGLQKIFKPGFEYKKAGVMLNAISTGSITQLNLFEPARDNKKDQRLMTVVDNLNRTLGSNTINFALTNDKKNGTCDKTSDHQPSLHHGKSCSPSTWIAHHKKHT